MAVEDHKEVLKSELKDALDGDIDDATAERALASPPRSRFATLITDPEQALNDAVHRVRAGDEGKGRLGGTLDRS
jgi:hypothetical protein